MSDMPIESELNNLSFESPKKDLQETKKDSSNRFRVILFFSLFVLFLSTGILGYYLFITSSKNPQLITAVEKIEIKESSKVNLEALSYNSESQLSIYLSIPRKDLEYLGQGVLSGKSTVITSSQVIKDYKSENLVIKSGDKFYEISHMSGGKYGSNSGLWTLYLKSPISLDPIKFIFKEVNTGDSLYLKSLRMEIKEGGSVEEIVVFLPFTVTGISREKDIILTDLDSKDFGNPIFNQNGELIGVTSNLDSKNFLKIVVGNKLKEFIDLSNSTLETNSNKEKLGIIFEFSELERFRKEGRPVGLIVKEVKDGQLAQIAGVKKNDVILTINNQVIVSEEELYKLFQNLNAKEEIRFEIIREDRKVGITLNLE